MDRVVNVIIELAPAAVAVVVAALILVATHRLLERGPAAAEHRLRNQLVMLGLSIVALMVVLFVLPIDATDRGQILSLLGIVISAAVALSATTLLGNIMAGLMLRAVRGYRIGDFIRTGNHFGRVTERGLFHTEIQTEDRELTTFSNMVLVREPVTTVRSSGTIISATVSLGYDVPRTLIEGLLLDAANSCGLEDPFVRILELGDFSVSYRVAGLLREIKTLLTTQSRLRAAVLDHLHEGGVEIVSPSFMNQRQLKPERVFIPEAVVAEPPATASAAAESVVFDKAEEAESIEELRQRYRALCTEHDGLKAEVKAAEKGPDRDLMQERLEALERRCHRLAAYIEKREQSTRNDRA
jgi:small-conductance mechanosensitive channel